MFRKTVLESWTAGKLGLTADSLTRRRIEEYQLERLRETVRWARAHSPFYRQHLAHFSEQSLSSLKDMRQLPFTTPNDLQQNGPQFLCVSQSDIQRVVTLESSGTSGEPKRVFFTAKDQELTIDFFQAGMSMLAGRGDRVLIALPGERPGSVGDLLATAVGRLGARAVPCGLITDPILATQLMAREQVDCVVGLPVQVLSIIRCCGPHAEVPSRFLTRVLLCSDHVPDSIVRAIHEAWNCEVFEHYGMTEMGLGGGVDCEAHSGYHLREADLYFEIVDVTSGDPVTPGQYGEIVFTTLTRRGMPFIRYRTGDISRLLPEPCTCGAVLQRLGKVRRGRSYVSISPDAAITMAELDEALFAVPQLYEFTAQVVHGHPATLQVKAAAYGVNGLLREALKRALNDVPAVRQARASGDLQVEITISKKRFPIHAGKRRIEERAA
ncbi:MAG TPA: AMP-binding protein [Terriglobales bacterium]|nr:AMP-binding protein [Terriglobales bacterium]